MEAQLRIYTVKPGEMANWIDEWERHVAPLRRRFGFRVVGPWIDEEGDTFVWLLEYERPDGFEAADARYYSSAERKALDPDPARHLAAVETRLLHGRARGPRLFRVIVPVGDLERARGFYARLLGSEGERVSAGRLYFDCGGTILALLDPRADGEHRDATPSPEHVYVAIADLDAARERALAAGAERVGEIALRPWAERSFYLRDPFGNPLCIVEAGTEFSGGRYVA